MKTKKPNEADNASSNRINSSEDEAYQDRRSYVVNEELSTESFRKIYKKLGTA